MGQVLHGCATTTHAVRAAIQRSKAKVADIAAQHGVNRKTVMKWRGRTFVQDAPMGPKAAKSTVLTPQEEAIAVAFRRHTLLPLDDCLFALQATIPHLTRSSLHRLFQRHDISRLPSLEGDKVGRKTFKVYPIGYFHVDIAEVRTGEGKLQMLVAIDRTSKFAFVELHQRVSRSTAADFLRRLIEAVPYKVHTILTDNGTHFTTPGNICSAAKDIRVALDAGEIVWAHAFELACARAYIDHRLTKPRHPWTNGQVERMNRTIKEATVKSFHYETHDQLREHLAAFIGAYNFAKRLKTLGGLTPYEAVCKAWREQPKRFTSDPVHLTSGLNR
jgi:transposase InsO family protein